MSFKSTRFTISELIAQECSHKLCRLICMFICSPNNILFWTRSNWIYRILNVIYIYVKFCVISYSFGGSLYLSSKWSLGFKLHLLMQSCARHQGRFACYIQLMTFHEVNTRFCEYHVPWVINPCIHRNWKSLTVLLYDIKSNLN